MGKYRDAAKQIRENDDRFKWISFSWKMEVARGSLEIQMRVWENRGRKVMAEILFKSGNNRNRETMMRRNGERE